MHGFASRRAFEDSCRPNRSVVVVRRARRDAFTLIEVLVAMAVTLLLMGIVVTIFGAIGENVSKNNSSMEMNDQLRSVKQRLQLDLGGVTAQMLPPRRDENGEGYFEIIEGPVGRLPPNTKLVQSETEPNQAAGAQGPNGPDTTVGDNDDMLMFTTRSKGEMFLGRGVQYNGSIYIPAALQSQVAEVAWFMRGTTLYRRQLLVRPDLGPLPDANGYLVPQPNLSNSPPNYFSGAAWQGYNTNFYAVCDLSARATGKVPSTGLSFDLSPSPPNFSVVSNSLEDLTKRENRFAHYPLVATTSPYGWPHDVRGWGIFYSDTPFGNISIGKSASANQQVPTTGRLGLPTLRECSSLGFPLPGAFELLSLSQIFLGINGTAGMAAGSTAPEPFDAWTNANPNWSIQYGGTNQTGSADPLTGALNLPNVYPDNPAPSPFGTRYGEDVILTHVLSFDVRVWDPDAALISYFDSTTGQTSLFAPGDPGYLQTVNSWITALASSTTTPFSIAGRGAYVDLNYAAPMAAYLINGMAPPTPSLNAVQIQTLKTLTGYQDLNSTKRVWNSFAGPGIINSGLSPYQRLPQVLGALQTDWTGTNYTPDPYGTAVYDTGSWHYENDGINQGPMISGTDNGADEGTNGLDDNGDGVVDDLGELEAPPPYFDPIRGGYPLRGIQIKIRCFDPDSQEIREVTVVQEFVPD